MVIICAWCGTVKGHTGEGEGETHGICWPCMFKESPGAAMIYAWRRVKEHHWLALSLALLGAVATVGWLVS